MATVTLTIARFTERDRAQWLDGASALLSESEREHMAGIPDIDVRAQHAIGRAVMRLIGSRASGRSPRDLAISVSEAGKPRLADLPDLNVSIAHTGRVVVVAACRESVVGVDIEPGSRSTALTRRVAQRLFSEAEVAALADVADDELDDWFSAVWTAKEAVGKALGVGIVPALAGAVLEVRAGAPALTSVWSGPPAGAWTILAMTAPNGNEKIAVALPAPGVALGAVSQLSPEDFGRAL